MQVYPYVYIHYSSLEQNMFVTFIVYFYTLPCNVVLILALEIQLSPKRKLIVPL